MNARIRTYLIWSIVIVVLLAAWKLTPAERASIPTVAAGQDFTAIVSTDDTNSYEQYVAQYASAARPEQTIRVEGEDYIEVSGGEFVIADGYEGLDGKAVLTPDKERLLGR